MGGNWGRIHISKQIVSKVGRKQGMKGELVRLLYVTIVQIFICLRLRLIRVELEVGTEYQTLVLRYISLGLATMSCWKDSCE